MPLDLVLFKRKYNIREDLFLILQSQSSTLQDSLINYGRSHFSGVYLQNFIEDVKKLDLHDHHQSPSSLQSSSSLQSPSSLRSFDEEDPPKYSE